jgi:hypothetical protein
VESVSLNLTPRQTRLLNGILLGKAKIINADSRPHPYVRETSEREKYIEWLVDEFESVDARQYRVNGKHQFQIPPHEKLELWRKRWYHREKRVIPMPDYFTLTPDMANIWYARRGELHDRYERVELDLSGMSYSMKNGIKLLNNQGFDALESLNDIVLWDDSARGFLNWIDGAIPGYEEKFDY